MDSETQGAVWFEKEFYVRHEPDDEVIDLGLVGGPKLDGIPIQVRTNWSSGLIPIDSIQSKPAILTVSMVLIISLYGILTALHFSARVLWAISIAVCLVYSCIM